MKFAIYKSIDIIFYFVGEKQTQILQLTPLHYTIRIITLAISKSSGIPLNVLG